MRLREFASVTEDPVMSSWITDLTLNSGSSGNVTMALNNGRRYSIQGLGQQLFQAWLQSQSKGKFWHQNIRNQYRVTRLT